MNVLIANNHPSSDLLLRFLRDQVAQDESDAITLHIESCFRCQEKLDELSNGSGVHFWSEHFFNQSSLDEGKTLVRDADNEDLAGINDTKLQIGSGLQFQLKEEIARGGMGVVYEAYDKELQRSIAVKTLQLESRQETKLAAEARFQREARISGQLQHPGVVPIHEIGRLPDGRMYIAMKLVHGQSMNKLLGDRSTSRERMLEVFQSVCNTMAYAHSNDVIHRDLKPGNIMVGSFGEVQVMDWGLAKSLKMPNEDGPNRIRKFPRGLDETAKFCVEKTHSGMVMGTPAYMAPEQSKGLEVDKRADVFSLGAILCEILTGETPFKAKKGQQKVHQNQDSLRHSFTRLNECGVELELIDLAKDCLSFEQRKRPANANAVSLRLTEYFDKRVDLLKQADIERARTEERFVLESKRRKQVLLLGIAIGAFFLCTTIASILYLSEKNASQVKRFNDQIAKENKIREIMDAANQWHNKALVATEKDKSRLWAKALKQINKAEVLLDESVNPSIRQSYFQDKRNVEKAAGTAEQQFIQRVKDRNTRSAIYEAIKETQRPDENLSLIQTPELVELFADTFADYDIRIHDDVSNVIKVIEDSSIKADLITGLQVWYSLIDWTYHFSKTYDEKSWFLKVLNNVDPDSYRVNLRYFLFRRRWKEFFDELDSPQAVASTFTTQLIIEGFRKISAQERRDMIGAEKYSQAKRAYLLRASVRHPGDFRINLSLAQDLSNGVAVDLRRAMRHWMVCLSIQPENAYVGLALASVLSDLGEYELAEKYYRRFWNHPKKYPQSLTNLATMCEKTGDFKKGLTCCNEVLKHYPDFIKAHFNRAVLLSRLKRYDESLTSSLAAVKIDSEFYPAIYQVAWLYNRNEQLDMALEYASKAVQLRPDCQQSWGLLANIRERVGPSSKILECFERLVALKPDSLQHWLGCANYLIDCGEVHRAIFILEDKFVGTDLEVRALTVLGKAMAALGQYDKALLHLRQLKEHYPEDENVLKVFEWTKEKVREQQL